MNSETIALVAAPLAALAVGLFVRYVPKAKLVAAVSGPCYRAGVIVSKYLTVRIGARAAERLEEGFVVTAAEVGRAALDSFERGIIADNEKRK